MKARIYNRVVEIPDERMVKGGVEPSTALSVRDCKTGSSAGWKRQTVDAEHTHAGEKMHASTLAPSPLILTLKGQIPSGKNAVMITRTGRRYPSKRFKEWRDDAIYQLTNCETYMMLGPVRLVVDYVPGNKIRRDVPGMLDAICHLLEYVSILQDDAQIKNVEWHQWPLDRQNPQVRVVLTSLHTDT